MLVVGLCLANSVEAAENKRAKDFDADKDGRLSFEEFTKYQIAVRDPKISEVDTDKDGEINAKEKRAWAEKRWWDIEARATSNGVLPEVAETTIRKTEDKAWTLGPFKLRKDHDSLIKKLDKAEPASVSFYRDNLESEDTWAVEGALGAVFPVYDAKKNPPRIGNYQLDPILFVPSVTVNRITGKGPGDLEEKDSVVFRAGTAVMLQSTDLSNSLWDYQTFSGAYRHAGAMAKGTFTSSGEIDWEPMRSRIGEFVSIGGAEQPPWHDAPFLYRVTFNGRIEFGDAIVATDDGHFFKLGPKVGLTITPRFFEQLQFFASYAYLWEVANKSADFDLLEVGARLALDVNKQFFLEAKYRLGQVPAKYTDVDLFQVSWAAKF